jgi:hypothetical protein
MMAYNQGLMIQNMSMFARQTMIAQTHNERKILMMSKLLEEDESLFKLLSARDWRNGDPVMPTFKAQLMSDKDADLAWAQVTKKTRNWPGRISQKQFTKFLRTGFVTNKMDECPGGFTLLMFQPLKFLVARSIKAEQNAIRKMLGKTKVDPETIRFYAENEFFIVMETSHLKDQLTMGLRMLTLLTGEDSITLDRYKYGLETLHDNYCMFDRFFLEVPLFRARFAHLLDKSFQNFASRLQRYHLRSRPIAAAQRRLEFVMEDKLSKILDVSHLGVSPRTILPPELLMAPDSSGDHGHHESCAGHGPPENPAALKTPTPLNNSPDWFATNPAPIPNWCIPIGEKFGKYFDSKSPATKDHLSNWPKFKHHSLPATNRPLCIKYQSLGKCRKTCFLAHVIPNSMSAGDRQSCDTKFKGIYG